MNRPRVVILGSQERQLREYLDFHPDSHERAAAVLFRRFHRQHGSLPESDRYIAIEVIPFKDQWITGSSPSHVAFELKYLRALFRRCEDESLVFGFVHNHPGGYQVFSETDEHNERTLLDALCHRNGRNIHLVALLWSNGEWKARIRQGPNPVDHVDVRHIAVLDNPVRIYSSARSSSLTSDVMARQMAAFGQPFTEKLQSLRVAVVGSGGTGSATVALLARAGVGELVIIDNDDLERSNLNRVRGAGLDDVGKNKARILKAFVERLKLPTVVEAHDTLIDQNPEAIDALSSCDLVFG